MKIALGVLLSFASLNAAHASTGVAYKIDCLVYDSNSGHVFARKQGAVASGDTIVVFEKNGVQYVAGATETVLPNKDITRQLDLYIAKNGKVIARSMSDFDVAKESNAIVIGDDSVASLSCSQSQ